MESAELSNEELQAVLRSSRALAEIAASAGEADAEALFASVVRACEFEQTRRATG